VRNFVRGETYARARLVTGAVFAVLGATIVVRTVIDTGVSLRALPAFALGVAMMLLAAFRFRDYLTARRIRS
jgi:drug/metabolite transporter (DMT)-like permease